MADVFVMAPDATSPSFPPAAASARADRTSSSGYGTDQHALDMQQQEAKAGLRVAELRAQQAAEAARLQEEHLASQREATQRELQAERDAMQLEQQQAQQALESQQQEMQALREQQRRLEVWRMTRAVMIITHLSFLSAWASSP